MIQCFVSDGWLFCGHLPREVAQRSIKNGCWFSIHTTRLLNSEFTLNQRHLTSSDIDSVFSQRRMLSGRVYRANACVEIGSTCCWLNGFIFELATNYYAQTSGSELSYCLNHCFNQTCIMIHTYTHIPIYFIFEMAIL